MFDKDSNTGKRENFLENDYAELWIENGIVFQIFKPQVTKINLEIGQVIVRDRQKLMQGISRPLFVDTNRATDMDKQVRDYFVTPEAIQHISASALLIHNYVAYLGAKLFIGFTKSPVTTEIFKTQSEALKWLEQYKRNDA